VVTFAKIFCKCLTCITLIPGNNFFAVTNFSMTVSRVSVVRLTAKNISLYLSFKLKTARSHFCYCDVYCRPVFTSNFLQIFLCQLWIPSF